MLKRAAELSTCMRRPHNTPLRSIKPLAKKYGFPNLLIKDESANLYGTWKDRKSWYIVQKARKMKVHKLALITSGNAGYSLAKFAGVNPQVVCIVDNDVSKRIIRRLKKACAKAFVVELSYKIFYSRDIKALARLQRGERIWDATNGFHRAYETIADEIAKIRPDYVICPVGSGEAFVGIVTGLRRHRLKTKVIGVTARRQFSFADKLYTPYTPYAQKLRALTRQGHSIVKLDEATIRKTYLEIKKYLRCEPSSCLVFAALKTIKNKKAKVVVVNSGKGVV